MGEWGVGVGEGLPIMGEGYLPMRAARIQNSFPLEHMVNM